MVGFVWAGGVAIHSQNKCLFSFFVLFLFIFSSVSDYSPLFGDVIQDGKREVKEKEEEEKEKEDTSLDLAQEVFAHLKNRGIVIPEDMNHTELNQTFREV